jgi:diadenosine tetraphosphate (Ap4A) HIT family hydrolase
MSEPAANCIFCLRTRSVMLRTDELYVQLDDAPIVEGHALIVPNKHYASIADTPAAVLAELDRVCDLFRENYYREYGHFAMFEHGRTGHCLVSTSDEQICHHAHVHVLPLPRDMAMGISLRQKVMFSDWTEVPELAKDIDGYLIVQSSSRQKIFYPVTRQLESHYLRKIAAALINDPGRADWQRLLHTRPSLAMIERAAWLWSERLAGAIESRLQT